MYTVYIYTTVLISTSIAIKFIFGLRGLGKHAILMFGEAIYIHTHIYVYIYIYIFIDRWMDG